MKKQPEVKVKIKPLKEDDKQAEKAAKPAKTAPVKAEKAKAETAPVKAAPAEKPQETPAPVKAEKAAPKAKVAEKKPAEKPAPKAAEKPAAKGYSGKWVISPLNGGYTFELRASNGEKMLSGGHYTTLSGAKGGIETYKNNIQKGNFRIIETKMGDFIFQLLNANGKLLAFSADYNTRSGCESAVESTRRFAATAPVEVAD